MPKGKGKEKEDSPWRDGFLFLGNHLALDFLNTRPFQHGEAMELLPDLAALLCWFQAAGLLTRAQLASLQQRWGQSTVARRVMEDVRSLRERLHQDVLRWEDGL